MHLFGGRIHSFNHKLNFEYHANDGASIRKFAAEKKTDGF